MKVLISCALHTRLVGQTLYQFTAQEKGDSVKGLACEIICTNGVVSFPLVRQYLSYLAISVVSTDVITSEDCCTWAPVSFVLKHWMHMLLKSLTPTFVRLQ